LKKKVEKSILSQFPVKLIYNGIDTNIFKPNLKAEVRKKLNIPEDKKVVLFSAESGTANPFKGGLFVESILNNPSFENVLFIHTGNSGMPSMENHVWKLPYVNTPEEMAEYYCAADVFLYPTMADNCPLVVLESMACGTPVLSFNTGGVPELIEHLEDGYIVPYRSEKALVSGLEKMLGDEDLRFRLGENAIEKVHNQFNLETMSKAYMDLYQTLN
jgi:glycosyltransferase involved in cell wall biosynthesis